VTSTLSSLAISTAGTQHVTTYADPGTASFTYTCANIGDIVMLMMFGGFTPASNFTTAWATSGTGACKSVNGANTLQQNIAYNNTGAGFDNEMWWGIVTATGSTTFTGTYNGGTLNGNDYLLQEFTTSSPTATLWTVYGSTTQNTLSPAGTTVTWPSITPPCANAAYVGYLCCLSSTVAAGSTSGYTYTNDGGDGEFLVNPACTTAAQAPTAIQSSSGGNYGAMAALILATPVPQRTTFARQAVTRKAFR
jgi:hypothetical protein